MILGCKVQLTLLEAQLFLWSHPRYLPGQPLELVSWGQTSILTHLWDLETIALSECIVIYDVVILFFLIWIGQSTFHVLLQFSSSSSHLASNMIIKTPRDSEECDPPDRNGKDVTFSYFLAFFAFGVDFYFEQWHTIAYMGCGMAQMRSKSNNWLSFYLEVWNMLGDVTNLIKALIIVLHNDWCIYKILFHFTETFKCSTATDGFGHATGS